MLHREGYRFRLYRDDLPGKPDLVFPSRRKVVFVNGCFWHSHDCRKGKGAPQTNADFWRAKRARTVQRDERNLRELSAAGWGAYIVWECELRWPDNLLTRLDAFLSGASSK